MDKKINKEYQNQNPANGFYTGFETFDEKFNGLKYGEVVVVGGRPAMGKTNLLLSLILNVSKNIPTLFFSYETGTNELERRMKSILSEVYVERDKVKNIELNILSDRQLFINTNPETKLEEFKLTIQDYVDNFGVRVVVFDYIQLMSFGYNPSPREAQQEKIISKLKEIAEKFNICVIVSSQLVRIFENDKTPKLSHFAWQSIVENADKIILLFRPSYYGIEEDEIGKTKGRMALIVEKNNNGNLGKAWVKYYDRIGKVE